MLSEAEHVGALLLAVARVSHEGYVLVHREWRGSGKGVAARQRASMAPPVQEWRVTIRVAKTPGASPRSRTSVGQDLVDALTRAADRA